MMISAVLQAGIPVEKLPRAGDRCNDEGSSWKEDCNKCSCLDGVVRCTEQICTPLEANDEGLSRQNRVLTICDLG